MSLFALLGLLLVMNPMGALLLPVLFGLAVKSDKIMDFYTYGKYVLLYFGLVIVISFAFSHYQGEDSATITTDTMRMKPFIIAAFLIRLVLGFIYINFTQQRLNSLSKSRMWLILLAIPIISPIFSLVLMFWKEKKQVSD